jgi:hypothetical protein
LKDSVTKGGRLYKYSVILLHALVGWAYCGALVGVTRQVPSLRTALIGHTVGAPLGFVLISRFYFRRFAFTTAFQTTSVFLAVVAALDFFLVAAAFEKCYAMLTSVLGTWLPFVLIVTTSYITGLLTRSGQPDRPN